jgi:hypothetical protein
VTKRRWTTDDDRRLREMHSEGVPYAAIGEALGRSLNAVARRCHAIGISKPASERTGRTRTSHGYIQVRHEGRYVYEHRLVVERAIGRPLSNLEQVHHINGVKDDNRLQNLELCASLADHKRRHRLDVPRRGRDIRRVVPCTGCGLDRIVWTPSSPAAWIARYPYCRSCAQDRKATP